MARMARKLPAPDMGAPDRRLLALRLAAQQFSLQGCRLIREQAQGPTPKRFRSWPASGGSAGIQGDFQIADAVGRRPRQAASIDVHLDARE